jgi:hypothetical protein
MCDNSQQQPSNDQLGQNAQNPYGMRQMAPSMLLPGQTDPNQPPPMTNPAMSPDGKMGMPPMMGGPPMMGDGYKPPMLGYKPPPQSPFVAPGAQQPDPQQQELMQYLARFGQR